MVPVVLVADGSLRISAGVAATGAVGVRDLRHVGGRSFCIAAGRLAVVVRPLVDRLLPN